MNALTVAPQITAMSPASIDHVRQLETFILAQEGRSIHTLETHHLLHGGQYSRTIRIAGGVVIVGVLTKIPTTLILHGDVTMTTEEGSVRLCGYHVLSASAVRKQAFLMHSDTYLTMTFPTAALSVDEAEREMTDESDLLMSRHEGAVNHIIVTGG